jgi:hypothetical protein
MPGGDALILAHGVGRVYESPLPLALYLIGAAGTVAASFFLRALVSDTKPLRPERRLAGTAFVIVATRLLRFSGLTFLALTVVAGIFGADEGLGLSSLLFWVGLIVGTLAASAVISGTWERADPWAPMVRALHTGEAERRSMPWWSAPVGIYLLFWFELVSGVGFEGFWIVAALLVYTLMTLTLRPSLGDQWDEVDPLAVLFGFAARCAPLRIDEEGLYYRGPLRALDRHFPMPKALFASVFVLLGSTTLDNVRETVGWSELRSTLGIESTTNVLVDSIALAGFAFLFFAPFLLTVWVARRFIGERASLEWLARRFGWSLIPIGIAYVLAHNAPLVMTGVPAIVRGLSDPLGRGWDLLGTSDWLEAFLPSPALVWLTEIVLIVGGHILGVLAAHRAAIRLGRSHADAVRSQYALTALMAIFTITTLWLLSQPLVA